MAMTPKPAALRQRRNKVSTAATLPPAGTVVGVIAPDLPVRGKDSLPWHARTIDYWKRVWSSEMVGEYLDADIPGLVVVMELQDKFNYGDHSVAAELRLQRQCFGLTPIDRRRLQWEVGKVEGARRGGKPQAEMPQPTRKNDPRQVLRAVK